MWIVVLFKDDSTLAAVPSFWFKNGSCAWPNKFSSKFIERKKEPNELEFKQYRAKILFKNIGTYLEARKLAEENSEVSSLENVYEDTRKKKFKNYKKIRNYQISSPPTLQSDGSDDDDSDKDVTHTPVHNDESVLLNDEICSGIESGFKTPESLPNKPIFETVSNKKIKFYNTYNSTKNSASSSNMLENEMSLNKNRVISSSQSEFESDEAFKKITRRSLITLKYDVQNIHARLDVLENLLEKIDNKLSGQPNIFISETEDINIIDNDDDLQKTEDKLINDALYRSNVIRTLSRFLSNNLAETIRKMMQSLFSDSFLMKYSYIGFKGKNQFSTLQCCAVIFEAVRSIKKYADVPNMDIEKPVKNWMAQAAQREKVKKLN